jgi:hypothetical protein
MSYGPSYELNRPPARSPQESGKWIERFFLLAFVVCLLGGVLGLVALWTLRQGAAQPDRPEPLRALAVDDILPELALRQLTGDPGDALTVQALQAGQLETARAILTYATNIPAVQRAEHLGQLARAYVTAGDPEAAIQTYRLLVPATILTSDISALSRAQLLSSAAAGLAEAGSTRAASEMIRQAQVAAAQAPELLPAQRSQVFAELRTLAEQLGDAPLTAQLDDLARNPYLTPTGVTISPTLTALPQPLPYDQATQDAIRARQQAARLLADRIALTGGVDIGPEQQQLAQTLLAEDAARRAFFDGALGSGNISLQEQAWLLLDRCDWLTLKARVALQGYGISLLPEWEGQVDSIFDELAGVYGNLNAVFAGYADSQQTPAVQAMVRAEGARWQAEQVERGLNPAAALAEMAERLRIAQEEMARQDTPLALPVQYQADVELPGFRFLPTR